MPRDHVQVRRNGPYAPLSAFYADDDAIATLDEAEDDRSELLFVRALAFCARDPKLEGFVSAVALRTGRVLNRETKVILDCAEELVRLKLWVKLKDGYRIRQWKKWNKTQAEIDAKRATDRARHKPTSETPEVPDDYDERVGGGTE